MRRLLTMGKLAAITSLVVPTAFGQAQDAPKLPDFSAKEFVQVMGSNIPPSKVYLSGTKFRIDYAPGYATIYLPEKDRAYNLLFVDTPHATCVEMKTNQIHMLPSPLQLASRSKVERTDAGTEEIEGHKCKIETMVTTDADGKTVSTKVWEAEDLKGAPVKVESQTANGTVTAIYRDIVLETPALALFEPPSKCTPQEKMGQVAPKENELPIPKQPKQSPPKKKVPSDKQAPAKQPPGM
jgi:hypothetical protein